MTTTSALRILVTGSRTWTDQAAIRDRLLDTWHDATQLGAHALVVVHGAAGGADTAAEAWALDHRGQGVHPEPVPADWEQCAPDCRPGHRRRRGNREWCPTAGHRRNQLMVDRGAAVCLAFQVGDSAGTADCMRRAEAAGMPVRRWPE